MKSKIISFLIVFTLLGATCSAQQNYAINNIKVCYQGEIIYKSMYLGFGKLGLPFLENFTFTDAQGNEIQNVDPSEIGTDCLDNAAGGGVSDTIIIDLAGCRDTTIIIDNSTINHVWNDTTYVMCGDTGGDTFMSVDTSDTGDVLNFKLPDGTPFNVPFCKACATGGGNSGGGGATVNQTTPDCNSINFSVDYTTCENVQSVYDCNTSTWLEINRAKIPHNGLSCDAVTKVPELYDELGSTGDADLVNSRELDQSSWLIKFRDAWQSWWNDDGTDKKVEIETDLLTNPTVFIEGKGIDETTEALVVQNDAGEHTMTLLDNGEMQIDNAISYGYVPRRGVVNGRNYFNAGGGPIITEGFPYRKMAAIVGIGPVSVSSIHFETDQPYGSAYTAIRFYGAMINGAGTGTFDLLAFARSNTNNLWLESGNSTNGGTDAISTTYPNLRVRIYASAAGNLTYEITPVSGNLGGGTFYIDIFCTRAGFYGSGRLLNAQINSPL